MGYTADEYRIYLKVKHALLYEDAKYFVIDYLAEQKGCYPEEITNNDLKKYDFEELVAQYEDRERGDIAPNDIWNDIVEDYINDINED